jgi:hypothetical protein
VTVVVVVVVETPVVGVCALGTTYRAAVAIAVAATFGAVVVAVACWCVACWRGKLARIRPCAPTVDVVFEVGG